MKVTYYTKYMSSLSRKLIVLTIQSSIDKRFQAITSSWPLKEFPNFILGGAYLIGRPAIPRLLAAAQVTPVLLLEDVYVTGLCAVGGKVELISNKRY